jgi:hypothetical protein
MRGKCACTFRKKCHDNFNKEVMPACSLLNYIEVGNYLKIKVFVAF